MARRSSIKSESDKTKRKRRWPRVVGHVATVTLTISAALMTAACVKVQVANPLYVVPNDTVRDDLRRMAGEPIQLERPVIVLAGYRGSSKFAETRVQELLTDDDDMVLNLSYFWGSDIPPLGARVVDFVEERFPSDDPEFTTEVDVVAISMGGLVARTAALPPELRGEGEGAKRLRINTLYTLATPHRGAKLAEHIHLDDAAKQMIPGSAFLTMLDEQLAASRERGADERGMYDVVPYAVLRDTWVGEENTAPPGQDPIWVPGRVMFSHHLVGQDQRILADLARRIRGEEPLGGPSPLPAE